MYIDDTIAAISTPLGVGGIAVIRVSGKDAIEIVNKIFISKRDKDLTKVKSHTIHYGHIHEKTGKIIMILVSIMKGPEHLQEKIL